MTYTETMTTAAATTPKPTISVARNPAPVAGQSFTTTWSTSNASSLSRVCTASGTGYTVNETLAVNGSRTDTASAAWVGYPSSCTWTASGAGGTSTHVETMTTTAPVSSGVTYIHTDGLGSPVARTNAAGQVISRTRYEPYGYVADGAQPNVGFTGHVNDADTGLTYMQQRYYDPVAGRFLSNDPVVADLNTGKHFNRYVYTANNPYRYIDPDGREFCGSYQCEIFGTASSKENQRQKDVKVGVATGAALGALAGGALSGGCDVVSIGLCVPANPSIVVGVAALGGVAGGTLGPPVMESGRKLAKNIASVFGISRARGQHAHHIVSQEADAAAVSRAILQSNGMDIHSAWNGMILPASYHSGLHTNVYHVSVQAVLTGASSYADVAARLTAIRAQIYMGYFPY